MKRFSLFVTIVKALVLPVISMFILNKFNLFDYISIVPENYRFQAGLTLCLAVTGAIFDYFRHIIERHLIEITCIFYENQESKSISNTPILNCATGGQGVGSVWCNIKITGNLKNISSCILSINLPKWLSSQTQVDDDILYFDEEKNALQFKFDSIASKNNVNDEPFESDISIYIIQNSIKGSRNQSLKPMINNHWHPFISLHTNCFKTIGKEG